MSRYVCVVGWWSFAHVVMIASGWCVKLSILQKLQQEETVVIPADSSPYLCDRAISYILINLLWFSVNSNASFFAYLTMSPIAG